MIGRIVRSALATAVLCAAFAAVARADGPPAPDPAPAPIPAPPPAPPAPPAPDSAPVAPPAAPPPAPSVEGASTSPAPAVPAAPQAPAAGEAPKDGGPGMDDAGMDGDKKPETKPPDPPKTDAPKGDAKKDDAKKDETKKDEPKKEEPKKEEPPPPPSVLDTVPECMPVEPACLHGSVSLRYRLRSTDDQHDSDLYQWLTLKFRDEEQPGWSASFSGRLAEDLDGHGDSSSFYVFDSVDDTYDSRVTGRLYHAYANYRPCGGALEEVRIGRQYVDAGDGFLVDGVRATSAPVGGCRETRFSAFVGLPAHLYEGSIEGDFICGLGVSGKPWSGAEARLDWAHVEDRNEFYGKPIDDLFTAEIRQRFGPGLRARAWYEQVNEDPRILAASFDATSLCSDSAVRGSFRSQLSREQALVFDIDPYYAIAQTLEPYWDAHLSASRGIGECLTIEGGGDVRRLWDRSDEGTFNREFERLYATVSTWQWPWPCVSLSLTGEWWSGHDQITTWGFEAEWKPNRIWRAVAGTDYALYRTDLYTATERLHSRGWYVRASYAPSDRWRFDLSLRIEDDSYDTYGTLQAGVRFDF